MSEPTRDTLSVQIDQDLAELEAFIADAEKLSIAHQVISDTKATTDDLQKAIPVSIVQTAMLLLDEDQVSSIIDNLEDNDRRERFAAAATLVRTAFDGLDRHPAILREMKQAIVRLTSRSINRDDGENTIHGMGWEPTWTSHDDKLQPMARVRFRGGAEKLLLVSSMSWRDITFVIDALSTVLERSVEVSKPIQQAKLLEVPDTGKIIERLSSALATLHRIQDAADSVGLNAADSAQQD